MPHVFATTTNLGEHTRLWLLALRKLPTTSARCHGWLFNTKLLFDEMLYFVGLAVSH